MKITFGLACDGRPYPDFPGAGEGVFDAAVVGPAGLVDMLEVELGLTGPRGPDVVRVAAYAAKLHASLATSPTAFFAASFGRDPWATAKSLLEWRDQLISSGWTASLCGSERPDALARIEGEAPALPSGRADRLCGLIGVLTERPTLAIDSITLVEPRALLPPTYRRLLAILEDCGVSIMPADAPAEGTDTDLRKAQAFLETGAIVPLTGDGSLVIVNADTALMAVESLAEWLASGSEAELSGTVVLSADGDTALLDHALQARGLPALGQSSPSPWRGALQVLPLAFAISWAPFDAKALLDLLMLPRPPIGHSAARKLARALTREPGTGAAAWNNAWAEIEADLAIRAAQDPSAAVGMERKVTRWREWTTGGIHRRTDGMPAAAAQAIAARVGAWAIETDAGSSDPLLLAVAGAATALGQAIGSLGQDLLSPLLVERMIEQVLADGARNPDHVATAGGLRCVSHPAAIWGPVARLVWWDFKGPGDRVPASPWSRAELEALSEAGCRLETSAECARRIGWSYANAVHQARERLILVRPALSGGEETISHPLAHQLDPLIDGVRPLVEWSAERLLEDSLHEVAGRQLVREVVARVSPPRARPYWPLPTSAIAKLDGRRESATSFERLADCQMRWMLLDVLRLSRGRFSEIPGTDQLLGNLAHEIANTVLQPGSVPDADAVQREVDRVFDDLLGAIAAPLQQPEFAGELAAARTRVPEALAQLARLLREKGLDVVGTELDREADFADGLSVQGRLDLLVRHATDGLGVIDLKWTKSAKRRRTEFAEGRALQLATYGAIADPGNAVPVPGAYFLLNQRRLIGPAGSILADEEIDAARSLGQTWLDLVETWRAWRDLARQGSVLATGVADAAAHIPASLGIAPGAKPCTYCELTSLCRVTAETA